MGNDGNSLLSYTFLWCNDAAAFCSVNGSYRNKRAFGAGFRRVVTQKSSALKSAASGLGLALVLQPTFRTTKVTTSPVTVAVAIKMVITGLRVEWTM